MASRCSPPSRKNQCVTKDLLLRWEQEVQFDRMSQPLQTLAAVGEEKSGSHLKTTASSQPISSFPFVHGKHSDLCRCFGLLYAKPTQCRTRRSIAGPSNVQLHIVHAIVSSAQHGGRGQSAQMPWTISATV